MLQAYIISQSRHIFHYELIFANVKALTRLSLHFLMLEHVRKDGISKRKKEIKNRRTEILKRVSLEITPLTQLPYIVHKGQIPVYMIFGYVPRI